MKIWNILLDILSLHIFILFVVHSMWWIDLVIYLYCLPVYYWFIVYLEASLLLLCVRVYISAVRWILHGKTWAACRFCVCAEVRPIVIQQLPDWLREVAENDCTSSAIFNAYEMWEDCTTFTFMWSIDDLKHHN